MCTISCRRILSNKAAESSHVRNFTTLEALVGHSKSALKLADFNTTGTKTNPHAIPLTGILKQVINQRKGWLP